MIELLGLIITLPLIVIAVWDTILHIKIQKAILKGVKKLNENFYN